MVKPTEVAVQEFRDKITEWMDQAALLGTRFTVTKHGKPRAALVSLEDLAKLEALEAKPKPAKRRR
ncbi:MAG: type II toxin-antitoxin system Phd/YefM family antitoxin [Planctomycetota bacterium]